MAAIEARIALPYWEVDAKSPTLPGFRLVIADVDSDLTMSAADPDYVARFIRDLLVGWGYTTSTVTRVEITSGLAPEPPVVP